MKKNYQIVLLSLCLLFLIFPQSASVSSFSSDQIIELTNQVRQNNNLPPLQPSYILSKTAYAKAQDILTNQYFSHISPQGKSPWSWLEDENYFYTVAGENLAAAFNSPQAIVNAWLSSATHRANLLDPDYEEIGVAVVTGYLNQKNTTIIVQHLASPLLFLEQ